MNTITKSNHDILWDVRRSIRYHERRRSFFETFNQTANAVALILGAATIVTLLTEVATISTSIWWKIIPGAFITIFSSLNLVIGTAQKAQRHHELARRFIELEKMLVLELPNDDLTRKIKAERLAIEADEPPIYRIVDILCHNELLKADGYDPSSAPPYNVSAMQRLFAPFFDFGVEKIGPDQTDKSVAG